MKKTAVWRMLAAFVLLVVLLPMGAKAAADTPLEAFAYRVQKDRVVLTEYIGSGGLVGIPGSYTVAGKPYRVEIAAETIFRGKGNITSVKIGDGVSFQNDSMKRLFGDCAGLVSADLTQADTAGVTDMSGLFSGCTALTSLDLSGLDTAAVTTMRGMFSGCTALRNLTGYETWDTGSLLSMAFMFNETKSLRKVDLSQWDLDQIENTAWCFQYCQAKEILLPDNLAVISAGFLNHATEYAGSVFTVPAGVKRIGYAHTLYDFATDRLTEIAVAEGNACYKSVDGILYSADGTQMLAIPRNKTFEDGIYEIPEGVSFLGELSFSRNYNISTLVLPNSYELAYVPRNDPAYILFEDTGNLNAGLNLNIAIYRFTGVSSYAVKQDNPRYTAVNGILYSKDMTRVEAVPSHYTQKLEIPDGVTHWNAHAMWNAGVNVDSLMASCPGVSIPASLTTIAEDQLEKLNRLQERYSGFTISVSPDNPAYYVGAEGELIARPRLADAEIVLEQSRYVYDGTPKTPMVTVTLDGVRLTEGEDFITEYQNNTDAGTALVKIRGMDGYFGSTEGAFTIRQAEPSYTIPGNLTAVYGQKIGEIPLPEGFSWQEDVSVGDVGTHRFLVSYSSGNPNYRDVTDLPAAVSVTPKRVYARVDTEKDRFSFTGKEICPALTVMDGETPVPEGEYVVSYENNLLFGTATVTVTDAAGGNYTVTGQTEFQIVPGPVLLGTVGTAAALCILFGILHRRKKRPDGENPVKKEPLP